MYARDFSPFSPPHFWTFLHFSPLEIPTLSCFVQLNRKIVHNILVFCKIPENAKKLREIEFGSGKDRNSQYLVQYGGGTGPGTRPAIRVLVKLKPPSTELFATLSELCGWSQRVTFRATCRLRGASAALPTAPTITNY